MSKKLKIVYIGNKLAAYGNTPTGIDTLGPLLEQEGYEVVYGGGRKDKLSRLVHMLSVIFNHRKSVDIVLIDTYSTIAFYFAWLSAWLCKRLGIKYVPVLRGGNMPERMEHSEGMCRMLLSDSFTNVVLSPYLQNHVTAYGYKTTLIENNIDLRKYSFKQRENIQPKLIWVRSFDEIYNPRMAIRALQQLAKTYPDVSLVMVGPDKDGSMQDCMALAQEHNLNVEFTDVLSKHEWTKLSEEADVFINTTNYDNVPISVLEAMALGLPVVSTNVGGIPFLIEDGVNGLLVPKGDVAAMAKAVVSLIENSGKTKGLSIQGRKYVEQYDWLVVKEKWNKMLATING